MITIREKRCVIIVSVTPLITVVISVDLLRSSWCVGLLILSLYRAPCVFYPIILSILISWLSVLNYSVKPSSNPSSCLPYHFSASHLFFSYLALFCIILLFHATPTHLAFHSPPQQLTVYPSSQPFIFLLSSHVPYLLSLINWWCCSYY